MAFREVQAEYRQSENFISMVLVFGMTEKLHDVSGHGIQVKSYNDTFRMCLRFKLFCYHSEMN